MKLPVNSESARDRIIDYLERNPIATVQALSLHLGVTKADIRYHLKALVKEKMVEMATIDSPSPLQRGRPAYRFRLGHSAHPDNFAMLSGSFLSVISTILSGEQQETALRSIAREMAGTRTPSANPVQRFNIAIAILNQHSYHARWEASPSGPRIMLGHCPYSFIVADHPQMCTIDRYYLEELTSSPLQQISRLDPISGKPPVCKFRTLPQHR